MSANLDKNLIHSLADVQSNQIGKDTRIWQFSVVLKGAQIGKNCNVCANVFIENDVIIGNNVTIKNGVQLWDGVRLGNSVFVGPNVTFTNDSFPRSRHYPETFAKTVVKDYASIGANATILPGVTIAEGAMIGAGAVVTRDVPPNAVVVGNPAAVIGYTNSMKYSAFTQSSELDPKGGDQIELGVSGAFLSQLPLVSDMRGTLSVAEYEKHIPFVPKRLFWVFDVPTKEIRGEHAHKELHEYLICVRGSVSVVLDDTKVRKEVTLDQPNIGLYIPPLVWRVLYKYTQDSVLMVAASAAYDASDYLREYSDFVEYVNRKAL